MSEEDAKEAVEVGSFADRDGDLSGIRVAQSLKEARFHAFLPTTTFIFLGFINLPRLTPHTALSHACDIVPIEGFARFLYALDIL